MNALKYILIGFITVFIAYLSLCLFTPDRVIISQSIIINQPVDSVYPMVRNINNWPKWHPWFRKGNAKEFATEQNVISWKSDENKGGRIEIVSNTMNKSIQTHLTYKKDDFSKVNKGEFLFEGIENQTKVSWILVGTEYPFFLKPATILLKEIFTKNFEMGLKNLKALSEGRPLPPMRKMDE